MENKEQFRITFTCKAVSLYRKSRALQCSPALVNETLVDVYALPLMGEHSIHSPSQKRNSSVIAVMLLAGGRVGFSQHGIWKYG
jgi:hypothetical protein